MPAPIPRNSTTCLLLIDNQNAFLHPTYWGATRSNPSFEDNISSLLSAFRHPISSTVSPSQSKIKPLIIHVQHYSKDPTSPLHPSYIGAEGSNFDGKHGIDFLSFMQPGAGERIVTKGVNSAFIGTELQKILREKGVRMLVIAGLTTDHCVSTTTRMAANLGVCEGYGDGKQGRIIFATDATATFAKGSFDAETVHAVNVESLREEFAEILTTKEIIEALPVVQ